jgi:hypothetical protein
MKLNELVDDFLAYYKLECLRRGVTQIDLHPRLVTLMLSEVCSDIQKTFGVVESSTIINLISGTDKYTLNSSVMTVKDVSINTLISDNIAPVPESDDIQRGTDADMAAYALTLAGTTDVKLFFNVDQNSLYTWNGSIFV